ncbi:DUF3626 domain-containing protein [Mailhella sp.]|uniref:DUF3626 domain-containing protein n=1 Tax=Mailhella sp. TaxID=1981029 RepID=UPI003AB786CF
MPRIQADQTVQQQLEARGVTEKTGVFGEHKVQLGKGAPIRLDSIKANKVPFQGFTTATKIVRGQAGVTATAQETLKILGRPGQLNAKSLLSTLKTMQDYLTRLDKLGELTPAQKDNALWAFASAVEGMSNTELAAVYQSFNTGEMDLLQTALMREGQINAKARDARSTASMLFDLQALVLKEVSNRASRSMLDDMAAAHPDDPALAQLRQPTRLSEQYGDGQGAVTTARPDDITPANLRTLVETAAESATTREKTAGQQTEKLQRRGIEGVSVKEMADVLRGAELTININADVLLSEDGLFAHPDEPMKNIFHLAQEQILPKGEGYLAHRDKAERLIFPELEGHAVNPDERPVYGALNVQQRTIGAVSMTAGYGTAAVVLKPDVARRATYIAEDTFFAPVISMAQERRDTFYALLDGAGLPTEFVTACRDANSPEHQALERWFDDIAQAKDKRASAFNGLPSGIQLQEDDLDRFQGLLLQAFGDSSATRRLMATHDNLETLITHMSDFDGNALALAAQKNADGAHPRVHLAGAQYIEAQIQGPLVPSRDIAEVRIDIEDIPRAARAETLARFAAFEQRTGIRVNVIRGFDLGKEVTDINKVIEEERIFQHGHLDRTAIEAASTAVLNDLEGNVAALVEAEGLGTGLADGALYLEGNALARLAEKFQQALRESLSNPNQTRLDPSELVRQAFNEAAKPILRQKKTLLTALEQLPLDTEAQKAAFAHWIRSAKALRSPEELQIIHRHAIAQAAQLREIANANPAPSAGELFRRFGALASNASQELNEFIGTLNESDFGLDDKATELERISFMSLALLQHGQPAMDQEELTRLQERLNAPEVLHLIEQLREVGIRKGDAPITDIPDFRLLTATLQLMQRNAFNSANVAGASQKDVPSFTAEMSLIPQSTRLALREVAPETAAALDRTHPGYPPFPAAALPAAMPANGAARRAFLVNHLDAYIAHEQTFERGTSVHGRGHIARAFIFASAMCSILEEQGVSMDRNAVLCGIAGHDLGRQGGGADRWEDRSANMTVDAMKTDFGADAMGADYEQAVRDSIDAHRGQTLEAMLLNAADSLDIGRTQQFDPERFAFLHGKAGETPVDEARKIRAQLAVEADLLQRLTNPLCQSRNVLDKLVMEASTAPAPLAESYMRQRGELRDAIAQKFADEWTVNADAFMRNIEKTITDNPQLFPLLSKYYRP